MLCAFNQLCQPPAPRAHFLILPWGPLLIWWIRPKLYQSWALKHLLTLSHLVSLHYPKGEQCPQVSLPNNSHRLQSPFRDDWNRAEQTSKKGVFPTFDFSDSFPSSGYLDTDTWYQKPHLCAGNLSSQGPFPGRGPVLSARLRIVLSEQHWSYRAQLGSNQETLP